MRIVLMGPPGAGKGTQAQRLAERFGMTHLSSGDLFRAEVAADSALGKEVARYLDAGELVPDETVVAVMAKAVTAHADGGLLLDGFPRTVPQAEALDEQLAPLAEGLDAVLVIAADDEAIVERITGRRVCPSTGKVYHVKFMPPEVEGICDETGERLVQRDDDKEEVVRQRLAAYRAQTEPVIAYYRRRPGIQVIEIDGNAAPDEVTRAACQAVERLQAGP